MRMLHAYVEVRNEEVMVQVVPEEEDRLLGLDEDLAAARGIEFISVGFACADRGLRLERIIRARRIADSINYRFKDREGE